MGFRGISSGGGMGNNGMNGGRFGGFSFNLIIVGVIAFIVIFVNINSGVKNRENPETEKQPEPTEIVKEDETSKDFNLVIPDTEEPEIKESEMEQHSETSSDYSDKNASEEQSDKVEVAYTNKEREALVMRNNVLDSEMIPDYQYMNTTKFAVNANFSEFDIDDFLKNRSFSEAFVDFGDLDSFGRPTKVRALVNKSSLSENKLDEKIIPVGWKNKKVNNEQVYKRTYLLDPSMTQSKVSIKENVFTGTSAMLRNPDLINYYYQLIRGAVNDGETVLVEATPIFNNKDLLPLGVQIRAVSYGSEELDFNVFIYNAEPLLEIDYSDGTLK